MKGLKRSLLTVALLLAWAHPGGAQVPEKVVEAEGAAAVRAQTPDGLLRAKDEATNRALRAAVEQGVGALVDSETMVQNFQLLDDSVYSQVKGYIKSHEVIADNNGADGVYKIKIRAVVALAQLSKDIKALNIVREKKNNPRVMIIFNELVDGVEQQGQSAASEVEKLFLKMDFPLVDKAQMEAIQERDAALSYANPDKAVALGRRFGAEVVIVGEATSDLVDTNQAYGVSVFAYDARISAKAIKVDTGAIITKTTADSGQVHGGGRIPTAKQAMEKAAQQLAKDLSSEIVEKWHSEVYNTVTMQIVAENANGTRRKALKSALGEIRGVRKVNERSFVNNILILDLDVDGAMANGFEEVLEGLPGIGVEVTAKTENRIDVKLSNKVAPAPVSKPVLQ